MYAEKLTIDVKKLIKAGLSIEEHFILDCIHKDNQELIEEYVENCGTIGRPVIDKLISLEYIQSVKDEVTFSKLRLTKKSIDYLGSDKLDHSRFFKELREVYPKRVKVGRGYRSLHQNLDVTEKKYKAIITSESLHKLILKCVKLYLIELESTNRMDFIQMLSTWINEKNYQIYMDEAINFKEVISNEDNYDVV